MVQVHDLQKNYQMADRVLGDSKKVFFKKRYRQIRNYEEYLFDNSYRIVKIFVFSKKSRRSVSWSASTTRRKTGSFRERLGRAAAF